MISGVPFLLEKRKREKLKAEFRTLWPELLDHIISGLRSGLSLSETVAGLGNRGPDISKEIFQTFESEVKQGLDFDLAMEGVKNCFNDPMADQVCEVLKFARGSGSRDTSLTLRTLADFIRTDLDLRSEIAAKHGWIRNSATLAAGAPWVLLLILALQPNTLRAYSSSSGYAVLLVGASMTVVAYVWMNRVGRIPDNPRVFTR
jgi:tight adherence protein B